MPPKMSRPELQAKLCGRFGHFQVCSVWVGERRKRPSRWLGGGVLFKSKVGWGRGELKKGGGLGLAGAGGCLQGVSFLLLLVPKLSDGPNTYTTKTIFLRKSFASDVVSKRRLMAHQM